MDRIYCIRILIIATMIVGFINVIQGQISNSVFDAQKTPTGYSWTITSILGDILSEAEYKYGKRDKSYTILGVELSESGNPQIWYPGNRNHIIIQITDNCRNDINRAVFQAAHEVIHCLSPAKKHEVNVLEEGLANLFAIQYCRNNGFGNSWKSNIEEYTAASNLVLELLQIDQEIISKLRMIQPNFWEMRKELLLEVNPNIPVQLARKLTEKF